MRWMFGFPLKYPHGKTMQKQKKPCKLKKTGIFTYSKTLEDRILNMNTAGCSQYIVP